MIGALGSLVDYLVLQFTIYAYHYSHFSTFLAGSLLVAFMRNKEEEKNLTEKTVMAAFPLFIVFGVLAFFVAPPLYAFVFPEQTTDVGRAVGFGNRIYWHVVGGVLGLVFSFCFNRYVVPKVRALLFKGTKKSELLRQQKTDARTVRDLMPKRLEFDVERLIRKAGNNVVIGMDENERPVYVPYREFSTSHIDVIGTTGAGKGVVSAVMLSQAIKHDEAVFVMDPKNDEWAPHVLKKQCEDMGKPFYLVDMNRTDMAFSMLEGATQQQIEELFIAGFSLGEKGGDSDFYKISDRKAAGVAADIAFNQGKKSLSELAEDEHLMTYEKEAAGFYSKLVELSKVDAINARDGLNLRDVVENGGCVYVIGSMRNTRIITAQRMLLLRLIQMCEDRDRVLGGLRPVCVFLDELKYHISKPSLEALGAARDKGMHVVMAHQSIDDLRDCPADLNGDAVIGAVVENCKIKVAYRIQNPETALWLAKMSGTIQVDDETRRTSVNTGLAETLDAERTIRQAERYYIDENMFLNLPNFVCVIYAPSVSPRFASIQPLKVDKSELVYFRSEEENNRRERDTLTPSVASASPSAFDNFDPDDIGQHAETQELSASDDVSDDEFDDLYKDL